ncbi:MAG: hypothetical protein JXN59_10980 [Anaerolineae bacterium]|nr:hypothetical protein [Anaerolineae bacterium]
MKARVLCLMLCWLALAGCTYPDLPFLTPAPQQATLGPVTPVAVAPTPTAVVLPTNTPVSLSELRTRSVPTATSLPTSTPPPTSIQPTRIAPAVVLPTSADLGIIATPIPTVTSTPRPTNTPLPTPPPVITRFLAQVASVDALPLALRTAEVPLAWTVQQRAPGTSLVIEQVFPDGRVFNVERPRHFSEIPSEGSGTVAPFLPGGDARQITLRLRVVESASRRTLAQADLTLPVNRLPDGGFASASGEACFQQPYIPSSGLAPGVRGVVSSNVLAGVPLTAISGVGGQVTGSMARGATFTVVEGPFCFRPPGSATNYRQWRVRADSSGQQGWAVEYAGTFTSYTSYLFPVRNYVVYPPDQCYSAPFLPDRGVRVGRGVTLPEALQLGLTYFSTTGDKNAQYVDEFMPNEVLTVLEGPYCFRFEPMPETMIGQRQWRLRSETTGATGWVYEYSNERQQNLVPVADGGEPGFQIRSFDVQPRSITAGQPLTITWDVTGVNGVDVLMWHDALPGNSVSLSGTGALLPLSGSLTVNAPEDVTAARFSIFGADSQGGPDAITVSIACRYPWFSSAVANRFCPNGPAQSHQAAYQPFENGYMVWFNNQIWAVWGGGSGAVYPDSWGGGDVVYPEAPPEGRQQPVRGFGTLWVSDANVRQNLGWATAPEQGYTLQVQATGLIHRPGLRGGYNAADVLLSLPDGGVLAATRSGDHFSPRAP